MAHVIRDFVFAQHLDYIVSYFHWIPWVRIRCLNIQRHIHHAFFPFSFMNWDLFLIYLQSFLLIPSLIFSTIVSTILVWWKIWRCQQNKCSMVFHLCMLLCESNVFTSQSAMGNCDLLLQIVKKRWKSSVIVLQLLVISRSFCIPSFLFHSTSPPCGHWALVKRCFRHNGKMLGQEGCADSDRLCWSYVRYGCCL